LSRYHLAQANVARLIAPLDDPRIESFRVQLDPVNALAERSPGFVWRLKSDSGNATDIRAFEDERILLNMSVWESLEALQQYVYKSAHVGVLRDRKQWMEKMEGPVLVLWWVPAGTVPAPLEAVAKLEKLKRDGPSPEAFTFRQPFPPPDGASQVAPLDARYCEWASA
jgi:hypothetical protein